MSGPTFYEFFAGGGMARLGLGPGWRCLFANDNDPVKCAAYRANFPAEDLVEGDVHALTAGDLPGRADLAWASFPCQDLSLAGARGGLAAGRSGAFFGFWRLMQALAREGRAPRALAIENVSGLASSDGGRDLAVVLGALAAAGYRYDARIVDAAAFLPQSRPRLFILGWRGAHPRAAAAPAAPGAGEVVARAWPALDAAARAAWAPLDLPAPPRANAGLAEIVEAAAPFSADRAARLAELMAPRHRDRLAEAAARARAAGAPVYGAAFRRMRAGRQRAEIRFDMAGCLRTPAGGSSKQILLRVLPDGAVGARPFTGREAARLMGLPENYRLPRGEGRALKLAGDGVAVPVARWLAAEALEPALLGPLEPAAAAE